MSPGFDKTGRVVEILKRCIPLNSFLGTSPRTVESRVRSVQGPVYSGHHGGGCRGRWWTSTPRRLNPDTNLGATHNNTRESGTTYLRTSYQRRPFPTFLPLTHSGARLFPLLRVPSPWFRSVDPEVGERVVSRTVRYDPPHLWNLPGTDPLPLFSPRTPTTYLPFVPFSRSGPRIHPSILH